MVFRFYDQRGLLQLYSFYLSITPCNMEQKKGSQAATYVAKYLRAQDDASSEEDLVKVDSLKFADFEPFMALFRTCRLELTATDKQEYLRKEQCNIRKNPIMVDIIQKMFDFDLEVSELDNTGIRAYSEFSRGS